MKICGIYKITSPVNKVYIGNSVNIKERWKTYKALSCKRQKKLYNSLLSHGPENHIFEIVEECTIENLICRERYWQDFYDVLGKLGLNLKLSHCGDKKQVHSNETILKMSGINHPHFEKKRPDLVERNKTRYENGLYLSGENHHFFGKKGEKSINFGKKHTETAKKKMSEKINNYYNINMSHRCREVIDINTGIVYFSIKEASITLNLNLPSLKSMLYNRVLNKTTLRFKDEDDKINYKKNKSILHKTKKVYQYDLEGNLLNIYNSSKEAASKLNISINVVYQQLSNKSYKSKQNYILKREKI